MQEFRGRRRWSLLTWWKHILGRWTMLSRMWVRGGRRYSRISGFRSSWGCSRKKSRGLRKRSRGDYRIWNLRQGRKRLIRAMEIRRWISSRRSKWKIRGVWRGECLSRKNWGGRKSRNLIRAWSHPCMGITTSLLISSNLRLISSLEWINPERSVRASPTWENWAQMTGLSELKIWSRSWSPRITHSHRREHIWILGSIEERPGLRTWTGRSSNRILLLIRKSTMPFENRSFSHLPRIQSWADSTGNRRVWSHRRQLSLR